MDEALIERAARWVAAFRGVEEPDVPTKAWMRAQAAVEWDSAWAAAQAVRVADGEEAGEMAFAQMPAPGGDPELIDIDAAWEQYVPLAAGIAAIMTKG